MTPRSPEREQRSEKTEPEKLPVPHTDAELPPLSEKKDALSIFELGSVNLPGFKDKCVKHLTKAEPHQRRQNCTPVDGWVLETGTN